MLFPQMNDLCSDHTLITATLSSTSLKKIKTLKVGNKQTNWEECRVYMKNNIRMKLAVKSEEDINHAAKYITTFIQDSIWMHTLSVQNDLENVTKLYPNEVNNLVSQKRHFRRQWQQYRNPIDKIISNSKTRELKSLLKEKKNQGTIKGRFSPSTLPSRRNKLLSVESYQIYQETNTCH